MRGALIFHMQMFQIVTHTLTMIGTVVLGCSHLHHQFDREHHVIKYSTMKIADNSAL